MHKFKLEVNDRLEVIKGSKAYKSLVIGIEDEEVLINIPINDGQVLLLHEDEQVEINSYGEDDKCYKFFCDVISKGRMGNISYYRLSEPYDIVRIQRRNFFRVGVLNPIYYKTITEVPKEEIDEIPYKEALMLDISGGGVKIKIKDNVKKEDLLLVKIKIKGNDIELKGNIVRCENTADREKLCGIRFLNITQSQSDKIVEELFEIMRKQRAKA